MSVGKTILFERCDPLVLLVHGAVPPDPAEWNEYVALLTEASTTGATGLLVLTDGVGPNSTQRKRISSIKLRTCVVTLSRVARGIVTALGWLGADIRAFAPDQMTEAIRSLGATEAQSIAISHRLAQMRLELAGRPTPVMVPRADELDSVLQSSLASLSQQ